METSDYVFYVLLSIFFLLLCNRMTCGPYMSMGVDQLKAEPCIRNIKSISSGFRVVRPPHRNHDLVVLSHVGIDHRQP